MRRFGFGLSLLTIWLGAMILTGVLHAQDTNFAAGGVSYLVGGQPVASAFSGTGLYARLVSPSTSTYAFTVIDAVPQTYSPFVVDTNLAAGVAQELFTVGTWGVVYSPVAAGFTWSGKNAGWNWSGGGMLSITPKAGSHARILPSVRFVKSSVSSGSGYQVIMGVAFGWGW